MKRSGKWGTQPCLNGWTTEKNFETVKEGQVFVEQWIKDHPEVWA